MEWNLNPHSEIDPDSGVCTLRSATPKKPAALLLLNFSPFQVLSPTAPLCISFLHTNPNLLTGFRISRVLLCLPIFPFCLMQQKSAGFTESCEEVEILSLQSMSLQGWEWICFLYSGKSILAPLHCSKPIIPSWQEGGELSISFVSPSDH